MQYAYCLISHKVKATRQWNLANYSSLPNRRDARNKCSGGKEEPFLISVVPEISMVVKMFRPVTVIKRRTKWIKVSNLKTKNQKSGARE